MKKVKLDYLPNSKEFNGELCTATCYETCIDGKWHNEYMNSEGRLYYGEPKGDK